MLRSGIKPLVNSLQREELNPNTRLCDLFGGALGTLINNNISYLIDMVCGEVSKMKGSLTEDIKEKAPFGTKGQVAPIMDELIDKELPKFLHRKESELVNIANNLLENRLSHLGFTNNSLQIERIESTIMAIVESPHLISAISSFAGAVIKPLVKLPLGTSLTSST